MAFLNINQLQALGLKSFGDNVLISDKASIHGASNIEIGSNVRVDDFTVLSAGVGGIKIGNYVHIATQASLIGEGTITLDDFTGVSSKVSIFSSSDDYLGYGMNNPMVPNQFKRVTTKKVHLKKHVLIGANTVILPGCILGEGVSVGALSVVSSSLDSWYLYSGNPAKPKVRRSKKLLEKEIEFQRFLKRNAGAKSCILHVE